MLGVGGRDLMPFYSLRWVRLRASEGLWLPTDGCTMLCSGLAWLLTYRPKHAEWCCSPAEGWEGRFLPKTELTSVASNRSAWFFLCTFAWSQPCSGTLSDQPVSLMQRNYNDRGDSLSPAIPAMVSEGEVRHSDNSPLNLAGSGQTTMPRGKPTGIRNPGGRQCSAVQRPEVRGDTTLAA